MNEIRLFQTSRVNVICNPNQTRQISLAVYMVVSFSLMFRFLPDCLGDAVEAPQKELVCEFLSAAKTREAEFNQSNRWKIYAT